METNVCVLCYCNENQQQRQPKSEQITKNCLFKNDNYDEVLTNNTDYYKRKSCKNKVANSYIYFCEYK